MRHEGRKRLSYGLAAVGMVVALAVFAVAGVPSLLRTWSARSRASIDEIPRVVVRRADLHATVTVGGKVDSSNRTTIKCELENLSVSVKGNAVFSSGASAILELVPDGTTVKKGDVLCRLDGSEYVEMARQQQINVERSRADFRQAELNLDIAKTAVNEYREGLLPQTIMEFRGLIALARSEWERSGDRLSWAKGMRSKGYIPVSQITAEESAVARAKFNLGEYRTALEVFERYSSPKLLRTLESQVLAGEAQFNYQTRRLQRTIERYEKMRRQVERCTIRAPHDGFIIYANDVVRGIRIEPGVAVRQNQDLFYLPDLSRMEMVTLLHESIVNLVQPGMRAKIRVEGLPDRAMEGHVVLVAQLPEPNGWWTDVRYYAGVVKLDTVPKGLMPGMTGEVEIASERRNHVLTVPPQAVVVEDGLDVCYVAHDDALERREVKLGQATRDLLEVTSGLDEGEEVVLDPSQLDAGGDVVAGDSVAGTESASACAPVSSTQ